MRVHPLRRPGAQRGSALLLTLIIVLVLAILTFSIVRNASTGSDAVGAKHRYDRMLSCTDAARELLLSQFKTSGVTPTQLAALNTTVDDQVMASGHYDTLAVKTVRAETGFTSGGFGITDISNRVASAGIGGQVYRMTVVCASSADAGARQSEVEFLVRFGL